MRSSVPITSAVSSNPTSAIASGWSHHFIEPSQYVGAVNVDTRVRPSLLRNIPALVFCLLGGLVGIFVDDFPAIGRVFGLMFAAGFIPFLLLLLTTWFEFGDGVVRTSVLGRVRSFRAGESTFTLHPLAVGFFAESTAVELRSARARRTVSLAVFSPDDRELIQRELRTRLTRAAD